MNKIINSKPNLKLFIYSCIISILIGVGLHFIYDLLNKPFIIGLFTPVNESIWEHLKLVLIPITTFGIFYNIIYIKEQNKLYNLWYFITKSIILSMLIIIFGHYGYKFIFKEVPGLINIIIYILSMIVAFYIIYSNLKNNNSDNKINNKNHIGIITLLIINILFIIFTIYPPQVELFKDPINNTFGIFMLEEQK